MTLDTSAAGRQTDAQGAPALISEEIEWRRPSLLACQKPKPFKMFASRWRSNDTASGDVRAEITGPYHTLAIALSGTRLRLAVSGQSLHDGKVGAGAVQISGPGQDTRVTLGAGSDFLHLHVSHAFLTECQEQAGGPRSAKPVDLVDPRFTHDPVLEQLGRSLLRAEASVGGLAPLYAEGLGVAVVSRLLARHSTASHRSQGAKPATLLAWRLRRVIEYIDSHLSEPITLADIAAASGLSRMHFAAQFRAATGLRPHDYLLRRRVERAQAMLLQGDVPLVHVALDVGFQTQSHFTCVFNRIVGESPGAWRTAKRVCPRPGAGREPTTFRETEAAPDFPHWLHTVKPNADAMAAGYKL